MYVAICIAQKQRQLHSWHRCGRSPVAVWFSTTVALGPILPSDPYRESPVLWVTKLSARENTDNRNDPRSDNTSVTFWSAWAILQLVYLLRRCTKLRMSTNLLKMIQEVLVLRYDILLQYFVGGQQQIQGNGSCCPGTFSLDYSQ